MTMPTSSTVLTATNQHQQLAAYYLAGTSLTCGLCYLLARWQGLSAVEVLPRGDLAPALRAAVPG